MATDKQVFDPTKVPVIIGGVPIKGWADGDMCIAEYDAVQTTKHVGTGGEGRLVDSKDRSGKFTARVADYAAVNLALSAIDAANLPVPIIVNDKTSVADLFFTSAAKLEKTPALKKGAEPAMNEWVFIFVSGKINHSGANDA